MTRKRKLILAITLAAAALILILAGVLAMGGGIGGSYSSQLTRGQKYLDEGDYSNAILCYQRAIQNRPEEADGYIGLAQVYQAQDKPILARNTLELGLEKTQSARIQLMLEEYLGSSGDSSGTEITQTDAEKSASLALSIDLLEQIAYDTYDDHRLARDIETESTGDGVYEAHTSSGLTLRFYNTDELPHMVDPNTGRPYSTRKPNTVTVSEISLLFGGQSSVPYSFLQKQSLDNLELREDSEHDWVVSFSYGGASAAIACDETGTIQSGAWNEFVPSQGDAAEEGGDRQVLSGTVINAVTGSGVSGAKLTLTGSEETLDVTSGSGGGYEAELIPGSYTVTVTCSGFVTEKFDVVVRENRETNENFTISPELEEGEIRIVLEWGASPTDLDSYLEGTTDGGASVFTSYYQRSCESNGQVLADLDVDDRNGYGPETTTIHDINGVYTFSVVDYTRSGTMSSSGATVKVYVPGQNVVTINICSGLENRWEVCRIDHGQVEIINAAG